MESMSRKNLITRNASWISTDSHILMKGRVKDNDLQFASCLAWETDGDIRVWSDKVQISGSQLC